MIKIQSAKPSICFVAPNNYGVLSGRPDLSHIGGSEIQQPMIARELVRRGYPVTFVTLDHGQPDGIVHDGIRVYKMCSRHEGIPVLRFFHPRWTSLCQALKRANADIYYQMNAGAETGQIALWCRRHQRKFIYTISSDANCEASLSKIQTRRERMLFRFGLRQATLVIAQTQIQQKMMMENHGRESLLIRACSFDPYQGAEAVPPMPREKIRILWVGRIVPLKRVEMILDLAERFPDYIFDIVGAGPPGSDYERQLRERAVTLPNVIFHGRIPQASVGPIYENASLLLCTSEYEGFPNTFMEAWARGVPTVSTVDPDDVISTNGLGLKAESIADLQNALERLLESPPTWQACSVKARKFFLRNHTITAAVDALEPMIERALQRSPCNARSNSNSLPSVY